MNNGNKWKRARRPASYDARPCEGRQAFPSTPTKKQLSQTVVMRCSAADKAKLTARAEADGQSMSELLRSTLNLIKPSRKRGAPKVDHDLLVAINRIGNNINQLAKAINSARRAGDLHHIDAVNIVAALVGLDRQLANLMCNSERWDARDVD
nr:plasmid mobilization relaxosome protein MobC [uncultured Cohaesibacter sp.]